MGVTLIVLAGMFAVCSTIVRQDGRAEAQAAWDRVERAAWLVAAAMLLLGPGI
jgi:hypothetical protein